MLFYLLPVGEVIICLWMVLEISVLYVRGICQRNLLKKDACKPQIVFILQNKPKLRTAH